MKAEDVLSAQLQCQDFSHEICESCKGLGWSDFVRHQTGPDEEDYEDELIRCDVCEGIGIK